MNNPFEAWGAPPKDEYPEPAPNKMSIREIADQLLDALLDAQEGGDQEEIDSIKESLASHKEILSKFGHPE